MIAFFYFSPFKRLYSAHPYTYKLLFVPILLRLPYTQHTGITRIMPHSHEVVPTCCNTNSKSSDLVLPRSHGGPQYHQADLVRLFADPKIARNFKAAEPTISPFARALILQAFQHDIDNIRKPLVILDNACGTGLISEQLLDILGESAKEGMKLVCGDLSEGMVNYVKEKIEEKGWKNAEAKVVDAIVCYSYIMNKNTRETSSKLTIRVEDRLA